MHSAFLRQSTLRWTFGRVCVVAAALLVSLTSLSFAAEAHFRVLTFNIHHGEGVDGKVDLARIAKLIESERADIVALQEVDKGTQRTDRRDFPAEFQELTGMTCVFSNNYSFQDGEYGNAVLTRFPVKAATNTLFKKLRPGEQRGILQLVLDVNGKELVFMNTHIDFRPDDSERLSNVAEIRGLLNQYEGKPVVLCGDFNDVPASRTHKALAALFVDAWQTKGEGDGFTIPVEKPDRRIDYVWTSKEPPVEVLAAKVIATDASDHLPVLVEFALK